MASETYDYEPFDNTDHTMKQIADAIRHKGYGKDVREAIAQGFEKIDSDLARITIKNKQLQNALGLSDDDLNNL
ncbi:hypothetical protein [Limosilactobacillus reuteri]|uniref:hypothetical protein n=1 Tax=Limosilactobacillus reuteri TaxID=1598 RepID=UPI0015E866E6|nr:hypothetical protein [Limosilactobacillus reuteri]